VIETPFKAFFVTYIVLKDTKGKRSDRKTRKKMQEAIG